MEERITIAAVGDIFLGRRVAGTITHKGVNYILHSAVLCLRGHDVVVGNLESPISNMEVGPEAKGLIARPASLDGLVEAGFNAVSIANNHIMDFGLPALRDTIDELEKRHIGYAGAGLNQPDAQRPLRNIAGKNVTLLAYYGGGTSKCGGANGCRASKVLRDIGDACDEGNIVVVFMHWGRGTNLPMRHQVELAHQMVDQGAKVVLGSGPHCLQPVEQYHGGVIAYSLGNFVFDQRARRESMILHVSLINGNVENMGITPIRISGEYCPEPIDPETDPVSYQKIRSLLIQQLNEFESDSRILPVPGKRGLTPLKVVEKVIFKSQRAYPLSIYLTGLRELVKERWFSKRHLH